MLRKWLAVLTLAVFSIPASAFELHGVKIEESMQAAEAACHSC